jgi:hypothetical protein
VNANTIGYLAGVVWFLIPFVYLGTAPDWRKTRVGRAFMWLAGSTAALFGLLISGGVFGNYPGREIVRGVVFAAVLFAGVQLIVLFLRLRLEGDRLLREDLAKAAASLAARNEKEQP